MNGPGGTGQEYTGKHRRDGGLGVPGPVAWGAGRPNADGRPVPAAAPMPGARAEPGFRSQGAGTRTDAS
jgi:hypothetical protein